MKTEYSKAHVYLWGSTTSTKSRLVSLLGPDAAAGACALFAALFSGFPRPVVPHVPALLLTLQTGPMISLWSWDPRSIWVLSTFTPASLGCCSDNFGTFLAIFRPVVPHTLALSLALSARGVSGCDALLQRFSWPIGCPPSSSGGYSLSLEALVCFSY